MPKTTPKHLQLPEIPYEMFERCHALSLEVLHLSSRLADIITEINTEIYPQLTRLPEVADNDETLSIAYSDACRNATMDAAGMSLLWDRIKRIEDVIEVLA